MESGSCSEGIFLLFQYIKLILHDFICLNKSILFLLYMNLMNDYQTVVF